MDDSRPNDRDQQPLLWGIAGLVALIAIVLVGGFVWRTWNARHGALLRRPSAEAPPTWAPPNQPRIDEGERAAVLVVLRDGQTLISVDRSGKVLGLQDRSPETTRLVFDVLTTSTLPRPAGLEQLATNLGGRTASARTADASPRGASAATGASAARPAGAGAASAPSAGASPASQASAPVGNANTVNAGTASSAAPPAGAAALAANTAGLGGTRGATSPGVSAASEPALGYGPEATAGLSLITPVATFVRDVRPTFRWRPQLRATGYIVSITDANGATVSTSSAIGGTNWQSPVALTPGQTYAWHVTSQAAASATSSATARFRVLDEASARELQKKLERAGRSNLLKAIFCTQAGLLDDAEQALVSLSADNESSERVRTLLDQVRGLRAAR